MVVSRRDLIEKLAALEHEQWVAWSKNVVKTEDISVERLRRWQRLWVPFELLSEDDKEKDRVWARKALEIVEVC